MYLYRVTLPAVAVLLASGIAMPSATADDAAMCKQAKGSDSIAACSRLIRRNARDGGAYNNRGLAYTYSGEYDHAIADYGEAIWLIPKSQSAVVYSNRSFAYNGKAEYDQAIADSDQSRTESCS